MKLFNHLTSLHQRMINIKTQVKFFKSNKIHCDTVSNHVLRPTHRVGPYPEDKFWHASQYEPIKKDHNYCFCHLSKSSRDLCMIH